MAVTYCLVSAGIIDIPRKNPFEINVAPREGRGWGTGLPGAPATRIFAGPPDENPAPRSARRAGNLAICISLNNRRYGRIRTQLVPSSAELML
jgi:hypothetical protein